MSLKRGLPQLELPRTLEKFVTADLQEYDSNPGSPPKWVWFATITTRENTLKALVDYLSKLEGVRAVVNGKVYYP